MTKIAVLGAGTIGEALLAGLLRAGHEASELLFTERYPERCAELETRYGITAVAPAVAAEQADVVVVAVKPQDINALLDELTAVRVGRSFRVRAEAVHTYLEAAYFDAG